MATNGRAALAALALAIAAAVPAYGQGGSLATVEINAISKAHGDRITLGDIADISSEDPKMRERLSGISLGFAPSVGAVRELEHDRIVMLIAAAFPDGGVYVEGPDVAIIERDAQRIEPSTLREAVEREALGGLSSAGATARLVRLDLPEKVEVPAGKVDVRASLMGVRDLLAPFSVRIDVRVDGQVARRLVATAQVEAYAPVLVAGRDLLPQGRIRPEDVAVEVRRLERPVSFYLHDERQLRGVAASRAIHVGDAIMSDSVVGAVVVKAGDNVRIVGEAPGVAIAAQGEARSAGRIGDRIQVKNTQSGLLLQAVIVGEGAVRVVF